MTSNKSAGLSRLADLLFCAGRHNEDAVRYDKRGKAVKF